MSAPFYEKLSALTDEVLKLRQAAARTLGLLEGARWGVEKTHPWLAISMVEHAAALRTALYGEGSK
jgi:hypothetical protein